MRILVADQNALLLAAIASTFGRHCVVVTATRREICLEHLGHERFDVVIACEKLRDYTGLELLSEFQILSPYTLQIYSAPAARLAQLQSQLDHFRLLGTLSYPIDPRKLLLALKVARTKLPAPAARPRVRHVVLEESEWDTGERLGILERELEVEPAEPPTLAAASPEPEPGSRPTAAEPRAAVPGAVFGAGDDIPILGIEETSVSRVLLGSRSPAAEEPLEVSFEQNPSRIEVTAVRPRTVEAPGKRTTASLTRTPVAPLPKGPSASPAPTASAGQPAIAGEPDAEETVDVSFDMLSSHLGAPANDPSVEPPPPPPPPPVDTGGAANEPKFDGAQAEKAAAAKSGANKPAADNPESSQPGSKPAAAAAKTQPGARAKKTAPAGPLQRKQAVPTTAQRAAFKRAVARRNAARDGRLSVQADAPTDLPSMHTGSASDSSDSFRPQWQGTSLSDLAKMATNKRPLGHSQAKFAPNRNVVMIGSGVAAVLLASVLAFQLTRSHAPTRHSRQVAAAQLFTPNGASESDANEPPQQVFGAPPGHTQQVATAANPTPDLPQPQVFDPDTAPADPPPPPALEHPGPMEPPSAGHSGPVSMMGPNGTDTE